MSRLSAHRNIFRKATPWVAAACVTLASFAVTLNAQPESAASPAITLKAEELVVKDGLIEKYKDREKVGKIITYRRPPDARNATPESIKEMDEKNYNHLVSELAIDEVLADTAIKKNFVEQDDEVKSRMEEIKDRLLIYIYYQKSPAANVKVSEEEMKAFYEENKKNYYQPYQFTMRHIFLSTYLPHTAKEGETLEGLAESISKDKDMVAFILTDDTEKQPRWVAPAEREDKLFKPLQEGEKLLIPMPKDQKDKVRERVAEIKKKLDEGGDFEQLAQEFSETEQKGVKIGPLRPELEEQRGKPILPEILNAIEKTEVGKTSEIVQTKHGFQLYMVEDKKPGFTQTFDEVKASIERNLTSKKSEDTINKLYIDLANKFKDSYKINKDLLTAESPSPDEPLISAGDEFSISFQSFQAQNKNFKDTIKTDDDLLSALVKMRQFNAWLLKKAAIADGIPESEEYKLALNEVNIGIIAPGYMNHVVTNSVVISDDVLKKFYDEHKDRYTVPEQYDLYLIGNKVASNYETLSDEERNKAKDDMAKFLGEKVKDVKTLDEFKKVATTISDDPSNTKEGSVGLVPASFRNGFGGVLTKLEVGKMSEPVAYGNSVYILWVNEKKPESVRDFTEVKATVENNYRASINRELMSKIREMIIIRAGLDSAFGATADQNQLEQKLN